MIIFNWWNVCYYKAAVLKSKNRKHSKGTWIDNGLNRLKYESWGNGSLGIPVIVVGVELSEIWVPSLFCQHPFKQKLAHCHWSMVLNTCHFMDKEWLFWIFDWIVIVRLW